MAVSVEIYPTRLSDVWAFERMRPADAAEVMASGGCSPVEAIIQSWAESEVTWTVKLNGEVAAMFGVAPHPIGSALTPAAVAWLLTTTVVDKYPITFFKGSRNIVKELAREHGTLFNYIDTRYKQALGWAKRIGFVIHPAIKCGVNGEMFHPAVYGG